MAKAGPEALSESPGAVRISLRVIPRARRNVVEGFLDGVLRVRVTAAPQDGSANQAVVKLLAKQLGLPRSSVALIRGAKSRDKVIEISGLDITSIRERLAAPGKNRSK